eukprot:46481-Prymnesium_polylepis.1
MGVDNIFAGGDICSAERFAGGERLVGCGLAHAHCICENIALLAGARSGKLQGLRVEDKSITDFACVTLGSQHALVHSSSPAYASKFREAKELREKVGPIDVAPTGWTEVNASGLIDSAKMVHWLSANEQTIRNGELQDATL